jgi:hypothetical protein
VIRSSGWSVNSRTARQLGIDVPPTLLTLADVVVE